MPFIVLILIAVSLSMDAFSLSLAYGTLNIDKKSIRNLSILVGIYHFFMPLIGLFVGNKILSIIPISPNFLVFCVLTLIGIQMIFETMKDDKTIKILSIKEMFLFGLAVSIDSFSVGLGLNIIYKNYIIAALFFSLFSCFFTFLGLNLGSTINKKIGSVSTIIGGLMLIIIGILYLI